MHSLGYAVLLATTLAGCGDTTGVNSSGFDLKPASRDFATTTGDLATAVDMATSIDLSVPADLAVVRDFASVPADLVIDCTPKFFDRSPNPNSGPGKNGTNFIQFGVISQCNVDVTFTGLVSTTSKAWKPGATTVGANFLFNYGPGGFSQQLWQAHMAGVEHVYRMSIKDATGMLAGDTITSSLDTLTWRKSGNGPFAPLAGAPFNLRIFTAK